MGLADRDYNRTTSRMSGLPGFSGGGGPGGMSFNTILIIANVVVFVLGVFDQRLGAMLLNYGHFSTFKLSLTGGLEFWRVISFQFLHANVLHIFMNMLGLYFFGKMVEDHLGSKRYAAFYLVCGIAGAVMYALLNALGLAANRMGFSDIPVLLIQNWESRLVGASAGVFGVIMACAYLAPNETVRLLFPPVSLKMKYLAYGYVGLAAFNLLRGGSNAGGDAAHIGGAIAGFFFIRRVHLLRDFFDVFTDSRKTGGKAGGRGGAGRAGAASGPSRGPGSARAATKGANELSAAETAEVDRILDKVKAHGVHSLSEKEAKILNSATARLKDAG
jgi:membrane associated rhomboid family serine protease